MFEELEKVQARHHKRPGCLCVKIFPELVVYAASLLPSLTSFCSGCQCPDPRRIGCVVTYQGLHGAVKSVLVVAAELRVGTLERRVSVGLGLVDTVCAVASVSCLSSVLCILLHPVCCSKAQRFGLSGRSREDWCVPVLVSLLALVVLRRVLRLCGKLVCHPFLCARRFSTYWPWRRCSRVKGLSIDFVWRSRPGQAA